MPRRPAKLSNCYVPLPLPPSAAQNQGNDNNNKSATNSSSSNNNNKRRYDGRSAGHELRRMVLETSVITRALGSSLVELGHTKVIAEVQIAAAATSNNNNSNNKSGNNEASNDIGCLKCHVKYAPHIGIDQVSQRSRSVSALDSNSNNNNNSNNTSTTTTNTGAQQQSAGKLNQEITLRESDLSRRLTASLLPVIILDKYPKCTIIVTTTVLQDDGSCLSAAITAASMALVDARVELRDVVTSCTVAVVENTTNNSNNEEEEEEEDRWLYLADPTEREVTPSPSTGTVALICLAMTPNHKEVTLWSQSGRLSSDMASHAMELCRDGCRTMHKFMRESWISSLSSSNDDDDDDDDDDMDSSNSNKMKQ
jgi:exosome complex component MTR3